MFDNGSIDPATSIGSVGLTVADLDRAGTSTATRSGSRSSAPKTAPPVSARATSRWSSWSEDPSAPRAPARHTSGLFHQAILVPSRADLAAALHRVVDAGWRLSGASDHLVSEALYLSDPEGNGIEIYRDRPREEWPVRDGTIQMSTVPLDLEGVLGELRQRGRRRGMPAGTRIGHVHLNVGDLTAAEAFYSGGLGFDVTVRGYPGALFLSAGGYHHHIGLNTWTGEGAPPPPPGSRGLRSFEIEAPGRAELAVEEDRLREAGFEPQREGDRVTATDPAGNRVVPTAAEGA